MKRQRWVIVAALLAVHCGLLIHGIGANFVTVDEVGHIPAGVSHWQTGTFAAYSVNPPLPRMIATFPLLFLGTKSDYTRLSDNAGARSEWVIGEDFIAANAGRYIALVRIARLSTIGWSVLAALVIYLWSRDLYGPLAGVLGVALWCFEPTVLAFSQVVTPDIPATAAGITATYVFWRYLRNPTWTLAVAAGLLLGVAQLTKYTLLILFMIWPLLWMLHGRRGIQPTSNEQPRSIVQCLTMVVISIVVINVGYGFHGTCQPLGHHHFVSRLFRGETGENRFQNTALASVVLPLPADYIQGIDIQRSDFEAGLPSYLRGQWKHVGWWYYYLYALCVKVPVGCLVLVGWGVVRTTCGCFADGRRAERFAVLVPAVTIIAFVSSQTGFSHHMRYVLPAFPFLIVSASGLAAFLKPWNRVAGSLVVAMLSWSVVSSLVIHPHSMSYFNEVAGGPEKGPEHLLDSNIDWGQDLLFLKSWIRDHPEAEPLGMAYFNNRVDPGILGIRYTLPKPGPNGLFLDDARYRERFGPDPGYYAVSVNFLYGMPFLAPDGQGRFQTVAANAFTYFRRFEPIARAGYSIYIYRISRDEADRIRSIIQPAFANEGRVRRGIP